MNYRDIIKLDKITDSHYTVNFENGVYMGDFIVKEDGFYDFWPDNKTWRSGYISAYILRALADYLDELNKDWQKQIEKDFEVFNKRIDEEDFEKELLNFAQSAGQTKSS